MHTIFYFTFGEYNIKHTLIWRLKVLSERCFFVFLDADSEGWSAAFVNKWLQTDFSPTSIAQKIFPQGNSEQ